MVVWSESSQRKTPIVPRWHNEWLSVSLLSEALQRLAPNLQGGCLLDIGCGDKPYQTLFPNVSLYVGIDIASASSADVVAHAAHLPFASGVFDCILCTQVMEHVEQPAVLLNEAWRVLKTGGQLLLSAPMYWRHHEEPHDFYRYTRYGLQYLLKSSGFEIQYLVQQGGAWRVVGQSLANAFHASIRFRTFGLKPMALVLINSLFSLLDRINYHPEDTCNFVVLARKG